MKRWRIRYFLVFLAVASVAPLLLLWDRIPVFWRWGLPCVLLVTLLLFGWFDLIKPFEEDDPAHRELLEDQKELDVKNRKDQRKKEANQ
jgi:hypothetical protein